MLPSSQPRMTGRGHADLGPELPPGKRTRAGHAEGAHPEAVRIEIGADVHGEGFALREVERYASPS